MSVDNHGNCPHCGVSLTGGGIWDHFFKEFTEGKGYWMDENDNYTNDRRILTHAEAEIVADRVAANYGATRTSGCWGRQIGETVKDRIAYWHCPDCKGTWAR